MERSEAESAKTWLVYVFPTRLTAVHPDIWQHLESHYEPAAAFPGTVRNGEVVVMVREIDRDVN